MNRRFHIVAVLAVLVGASLPGCATRPGAQKSRNPSTAQRTAKKDVETGEESTDQRIKAIAHFASGISAELNDDDDAALDHYLKAAAADPGHEVLVLELARRFLQAKQPDKAIDLLVKVTASPRASGRIFAWLGRAYAEAGKTELAVKADQAAISKAPDSLPGYRNLFLIHQESRQPAEALKVLDAAARQSSDDPEFWVELGGLYATYLQLHPDESQGLKPKIIGALDRAAALKPQNLLLIQKLADGYKQSGELTKAEGFYLELLDRFPALPGTRENLADIYLRDGRKDKAAEQLEAISRDNPRNPQAYYYLGNIAYQEKRFADAADYFEKALALKPEFEPVYYRLADVQISLNKPRDALSLLDKARARFKQNFLLEFLTGVAHARAKEYGEAIKHYTEAEVIARAGEPDSLTYVFYFQCGSAFERHGDSAEAEKYFRKCLELSPNFSEAMNYLGYMWADRGENLDEAKKLIGRALELEPKNPAYLDSMGWVLFKLRQPRGALGWLQQAVQQSKEPDPTLYDHLGDIYAGLKQLDKARDAWRKSVELEPNEQVKRKLDTARTGTPPE
ncbi:MAG TPA: tetratricopeptide repeat protein [Candidatus Angelobacter sp.]|nr:tetratricopeptide repeat protein [Candidatus Angelobacter sp.]